MIFKGFKFGMILQLAIGPMCMFVFQNAVAGGFWSGEMSVLGTALVDSSEIILAILGVAAILERSKKAEKFLKIFGVAILLLFGAASIFSAFHISILPSLQLGALGEGKSILIKAVILALSDPLTIVFWAGIFSAKITEEKMTRGELYQFACGCVLATLSFLSFVSLMGTVTKQVLPDIVVSLLNFGVGLCMFWFAYKHWKAKPKTD